MGLSIGTRWAGARQVFRLSWHCGLFQFLMPVIGYALGSVVSGIFSHYASVAAGCVLFVIAARMLFDTVKGDGKVHESDPTRGLTLIGIAVATSIDALGVGIGLGLTESSLLFPAIIIGITASLMTLAAMFLGKVLSMRFGKAMGIIGALVLFVVGGGLITA